MVGQIQKLEKGFLLWTAIDVFEPSMNISHAPVPRNLDDIFALQDEITARIVSAPKVSLTANERARGEAAPTKDMAAYDLFLRGRVAMFPPSADGNARASALLEQAIERDPAFADAYAHLGYAYFLASAFMWTGEAGNRKALEMAEKVVELNPGSACARAGYGGISCACGDHERAVAELEHAIELDPNDADSYHWLAETMNYMGEPERGLELANTAMRFSPHLHGAVLAHSNYLLGRYDEAFATLHDAKVRAPDFQSTTRTSPWSARQSGARKTRGPRLQPCLTWFHVSLSRSGMKDAPRIKPGSKLTALTTLCVR